MSYCQAAPGHPFHGPYHDREYGFPLSRDEEFFERLILEINQAGLSWLTILKKRESFRLAYDHFDIDRVAAYGATDRNRLLCDAGIIRNRLKVDAAIHNAQVIKGLRSEYGGFNAWLESHHPRTKHDWVSLFRNHFKFTGGEIVGEFLMSTGYLPGAHAPECPVYQVILSLEPPWLRASDSGQ